MMEKNKEFYRKIFEEHILCDTKILSEDGCSFEVHRVILASKSSFFFDLFNYFPNDRQPTLIPNVRGETLKEVLYFIYTDSVAFNKDNFIDILVASDFLHIEELYNKSKKYAESILSTENCLPIYVISKKINEDHLRFLSLRFMKTNFIKLRNEANFAEISVEVLKEILKSNSLQVDGEKVVFECIREWARRDPPKRFKEVCSLLKCLKLGDIEEPLASEIIQSDIVSRNEYCFELEKMVLQKFESSLDALKWIINNSAESPEIPLSDTYSHRLPNCVHVIFGCRETLGENSNPGIYITYDEKFDLWIKLGEFEEFSCDAHVNFVGGNIYAFDFVPDKIMVFNLYDQEWREMENALESIQWDEIWNDENNAFQDTLPTVIRWVNVGSKIYFIYRDSDDLKLKIKIYNTENSLWSDGYVPMQVIFYDLKAVSLQNKIFIVIQVSLTGHLRALVYDEVLNLWYFIASPSIDRQEFLLKSYNDKIYIFGGRNSNNQFNNEVEVLDIATNEWERIDNLPFGADYANVFIFKEQLFVFLYDDFGVPRQMVLNQTTWIQPKEPFPLRDFQYYFEDCHVFHTVYDKHMISELVNKSRLPETIVEKSPFK